MHPLIQVATSSTILFSFDFSFSLRSFIPSLFIFLFSSSSVSLISFCIFPVYLSCSFPLSPSLCCRIFTSLPLYFSRSFLPPLFPFLSFLHLLPLPGLFFHHSSLSSTSPSLLRCFLFSSSFHLFSLLGLCLPPPSTSSISFPSLSPVF